jgi:hypothetical protein
MQKTETKSTIPSHLSCLAKYKCVFPVGELQCVYCLRQSLPCSGSVPSRQPPEAAPYTVPLTQPISPSSQLHHANPPTAMWGPSQYFDSQRARRSFDIPELPNSFSELHSFLESGRSVPPELQRRRVSELAEEIELRNNELDALEVWGELTRGLANDLRFSQQAQESFQLGQRVELGAREDQRSQHRAAEFPAGVDQGERRALAGTIAIAPMERQFAHPHPSTGALHPQFGGNFSSSSGVDPSALRLTAEIERRQPAPMVPVFPIYENWPLGEGTSPPGSRKLMNRIGWEYYYTEYHSQRRDNGVPSSGAGREAFL